MIRRLSQYSDQLATIDIHTEMEPVAYWDKKKFGELIERGVDVYVSDDKGIQAYIVIYKNKIRRFGFLQFGRFKDLMNFLKYERTTLSISVPDTNDALNQHRMFALLDFNAKIVGTKILFTWRSKSEVH